MHELRYGTDSRVQLDLPAENVLANWASPRGISLADPIAAVAEALAAPLDFPPLARSTVPGDRIVIALDEGVPQPAAVVAGILQVLLAGNADPEDVTIVRATAGPSPTELLPPEVREAIRVVDHDPHDHGHLCYLAADKHDAPIYLNRTLCEADVVLPVGALRIDSSWGYWGIHGGLYPAFSDDATRRKFQEQLQTLDQPHAGARRALAAAAAEVAWLLGSHFTLQVVPGPGESLLHVLAGDADSVLRQGRRLCEAAWLCEAPRRASLVVASIEGGPETQTWSNVARALFSASQVVADDGAIVLCTRLGGEPGPVLRNLAATDKRKPSRLRKDRSPEAVAGHLLLEAQQRCRVYLLSELDEEFVEDLGMGHVSEPEQIGRLSRQFDSCILVGNAQHAVLTTREEE